MVGGFQAVKEKSRTGVRRSQRAGDGGYSPLLEPGKSFGNSMNAVEQEKGVQVVFGS